MKIPRTILAVVMVFITTAIVTAQQQSRESMAVDATATQWSFQFAYDGAFDYRTDEIAPGVIRPTSNKGFFQGRVVAPIPKTEDFPITLLPRLTLRMVQNQADEFGFASSDLFVLSILNDWGTGRWGIGPQVTFPAAEGFGPDVFGYGLAGAIVQRALDDKLFFGLLMQQVWRSGPDGVTRASNLGINPIFVFQLGSGWYLGNGDMVALYNWHDGSMLVPLGIRLGKAFINPDGTWNTYVEYRAPVIVADWKGAIPEHSIRINVQYQIPVSL